MSPRVLLILTVGVAAVVEDLGWRRISNWTSGGAVAVTASTERGLSSCTARPTAR